MSFTNQPKWNISDLLEKYTTSQMQRQQEILIKEQLQQKLEQLKAQQLGNFIPGQKSVMPPQEEGMPEDFQEYMRNGGGIHIDPSKKGTFKAQASRMGMSVQEAAKHILANKEKYSAKMVKKANFARNFAKEEGGEMFDMDFMTGDDDDRKWWQFWKKDKPTSESDMLSKEINDIDNAIYYFSQKGSVGQQSFDERANNYYNPYTQRVENLKLKREQLIQKLNSIKSADSDRIAKSKKEKADKEKYEANKRRAEEEARIKAEQDIKNAQMDVYKAEDSSTNKQYGGQLDEYKSGGYTVRRSNDRKGKTHVVIGPDGTKKYFGDPGMGERSKSKYGKEAFYKRHAQNLKDNPYFRAYARATWEEGGEIENEDYEMVSGIADILQQVKDKENRRQIAENMIKDFEDEDVDYNLQKFMDMAKLKRGGQLKKYPEGGIKNSSSNPVMLPEVEITPLTQFKNSFPGGQNMSDAEAEYLMNRMSQQNMIGNQNNISISPDYRTEAQKDVAARNYQYINEPGFNDIDYLSIPLMAMGNPFEISNRLKKRREIDVESPQNSGYRKTMEVTLPALNEALIGSLIGEGMMSGLQKFIPTKLLPNLAPGMNVTKDAAKQISRDMDARFTKEWRNPETGEIQYMLDKEDYAFGDHWETVAPLHFKEYVEPMMGKYYAKSGGYDEMYGVRKELEKIKNKLYYDAERKGVVGKDRFYTDAELNRMLDQYEKTVRSWDEFKKAYPEDPSQSIWNAISGNNERQELFETLYPNAKMPNFYEKFYAEPALEKEMRSIIPYNQQMSNKLMPRSLRIMDAGQDELLQSAKPFTEQASRWKPNFDDPKDVKDYVMEMRGGLGLSMDKIKNMSYEELKDAAKEADNRILESMKERYLNDINQKYSGIDAFQSLFPNKFGGQQMIKRADGSYSERGLWDNIRANKGSGKKPTKEMLKQERKIKRKK